MKHIRFFASSNCISLVIRDDSAFETNILGHSMTAVQVCLGSLLSWSTLGLQLSQTSNSASKHKSCKLKLCNITVVVTVPPLYQCTMTKVVSVSHC